MPPKPHPITVHPTDCSVPESPTAYTPGGTYNPLTPKSRHVHRTSWSEPTATRRTSTSEAVANGITAISLVSDRIEGENHHKHSNSRKPGVQPIPRSVPSDGNSHARFESLFSSLPKKHAQLIQNDIPEFDLEDVGERIEELPADLTGIRNVMVTGGAGFIGSFLVRKLVVLYPELNIYVIDKLDYCGTYSNLRVLSNFHNFQFIKADITSPDFMFYLLQEKEIDVIFHLAAQTHVDNSFGDSFEFTRNNVMGTHVLLEAAKAHGIKRFVHVSTDEVYGEVVSRPDCPEDTILAPSNPYSATKAAAECLVMSYWKSFGLPILITRSNNVYGPYQYPEKICSKFICSLIRGGRCYVHGDGSNSRKYLYAGDVATALDVVLRKGTPGESYNIGSAFEISNLNLARRLIGHFVDQDGQPLEESDHLEFVRDRAFNDQRYAVDCSKIELLGWKPRMPFSEGLCKTIDWYKENAEEWWGDIANALVPHPLKALPFQHNGPFQ